MKEQAILTSAVAVGDLICLTPTIRKIAEVYREKITVFSNNPLIFKNLPYVKASYHSQGRNEEELSEKFDLHRTFFLIGKRDSRGIEFKHAMCDIRQFHAKDLGFMLKPDELNCDYVAANRSDAMKGIVLPEKYIAIHPVQSWGSRTWDVKKWQSLCDSLAELNIPVVALGKNSGEHFDHISQDKPTFKLKIKNGVDLTNKTSMDQTWHIINDAKCVITMDSGILHLAGTTDTHIIQLGSSIDPHFRAPYRQGSQFYKYTYVAGSCNIHCASQLKYSLRDWGNIQAVTLIDTCLENKKSFECHPTIEQVLEKSREVFHDVFKKEEQKVKHTFENPNLVSLITDDNSEKPELIKIQSGSLGDTIGALAAIDSYAGGKRVGVISKLGSETFGESYPNMEFWSHDTEPEFDSKRGIYRIEDKEYSTFKRIFYKFEKPLILGYAEQLGVTNWKRPKIDLKAKERPIKSKYVCFSMHSTAQSKHWNYPNGWDLLCRMLRKEGITPICIDRHDSFGIEGWWNKVPAASVKRQGMNLEEMTNYIHHSEFFIGISSGLSWVAHALGKPVILISGVTTEDNEFEEDTLRIINKSVCNSCINFPEKYPFDSGDWLWCPEHKGTDKHFECTKSITPEEVFQKIKEKFL